MFGGKWGIYMQWYIIRLSKNGNLAFCDNMDECGRHMLSKIKQTWASTMWLSSHDHYMTIGFQMNKGGLQTLHCVIPANFDSLSKQVESGIDKRMPPWCEGWQSQVAKGHGHRELYLLGAIIMLWGPKSTCSLKVEIRFGCLCFPFFNCHRPWTLCHRCWVFPWC